MTIPFLRNLPGLSGPRIQQVVAASGDQRAVAAKATLQQLLAQLPELLLALVLDTASGLPLASYTTERHYQPMSIAATAVQVMQQLQASLQTQPAPVAEQLQEVLLTLSNQLHLTRLGTTGQALLYLVVNAHDTNLAIARQVAQQAMHDFDNSL